MHAELVLITCPACERAGSVRGDKGPWVTHILGGRDTAACPYASAAAKEDATAIRDAEFAKKQKTREAVPAATGQTSTAAQTAAAVTAGASTSQKHSRSDSSSGEPHAKRMKQAVFQVYSGMDQPFSAAEAAEFQAQALRATVSAGLAFRVWENREVQKLFGLCRTVAPELLPSRKIVGGRLLDDAAEKVEQQVSLALQGKEIGLWYVDGCLGPSRS